MVAAAIGLSLLAIVITLVTRLLGQTDYDGGIWAFILVLPLVGFPIGFLLLIVLIILTAVRRGRAARDAGKQ